MTAVAPVASVGSPIDSGSRSGRAPNTPDSYTSCRSGETVRCARLHTMFGKPTPTKQLRDRAELARARRDHDLGLRVAEVGRGRVVAHAYLP